MEWRTEKARGLNEVLGGYLDHHRSKGSMESTLRTYERKIGHYILFIERVSDTVYAADNPHLADLQTLARYYQELGKTQGTVTRNHTVTILRNFFGYLKMHGLLHEDQYVRMCGILAWVKPKQNRLSGHDIDSANLYEIVPVEKKQIPLLAPGMIDKLLTCERGYSHDRNRAIMALFLSTGLRAEELCSLNVADYHNMRRGKILCKRKGGEYCWVDVANAALPYINHYLMGRTPLLDDAPLFETKIGTRMTPRNLYGVLQTRFTAVGIEAGTHDFRRAFLTATEQASSPAIAMALANHKGLRTTSRYTIPTPEDRRTAVNNLPYMASMQRQFGNTHMGRKSDGTQKSTTKPSQNQARHLGAGRRRQNVQFAVARVRADPGGAS